MDKLQYKTKYTREPIFVRDCLTPLPEQRVIVSTDKVSNNIVIIGTCLLDELEINKKSNGSTHITSVRKKYVNK